MGSKTKKFVLTGLMTSLVFVLTFIFPVPVPYTSGYIHLGDSMIYISVIILGPYFGAFASGVGSMLADLLAGYAQYAVPTLIIKSFMAFIMGLILSGKTRKTTIYSVITALSVWLAFSAGSVIYLNKQIHSIGFDELVGMIAGTDATQEAITSTARLVKNLPLYLTIGLGLLIVVLSAISWLMSKHDGHKVFSLKAVIGMSAAGMCMVMGYFLAESLMYTPIAALLSVPMNMIQFFAGVITAGIFAPAITKLK
ncbi:MAG: hypothetical protein GX227_02320 [Clostridiaceae bacterium]|jgi:uncharacterized membrane protein|nr:hypothetical protein [Clostridiaceae bacterium]